MKTRILTFICIAFLGSIAAQTNFEKGMQKAFDLWKADKTEDAQNLFERIANAGADCVVIALGLDASEHDPFQALAITTKGFERIGTAIAGLGLPLLLVQEGGYLCDALSDNLTAFLSGVQGS